MMRKSKTNGVAGNCCCLVPVLILLAIIVAALIGSAFVWHSVISDVFSWDSGHHHHRYDAYRDGFEEGNRLGATYARRGDPAPTGQDLDTLARREADRLEVRRDRGRWIEGFRNGFERGFGSFSNQALNDSASRSRLGAERDFPLKLA
jgi:hypothetical protein